MCIRDRPLAAAAGIFDRLAAAANYEEDARVAEDEEGEDKRVERDEVPDAVRQFGRAAGPERDRVADAVPYVARQEYRNGVGNEAAGPRERHRQVDHPPAQVDMIYLRRCFLLQAG